MLIFFFLRQGLTLLPTLECSSTILAHCSLCPLGSSEPLTSASQVAGTTGMHHYTWLSFWHFLLETGFHHVAQADLKLLGLGDSPAWASQIARITGVSHHAQPDFYLFFLGSWSGV